MFQQNPANRFDIVLVILLIGLPVGGRSQTGENVRAWGSSRNGQLGIGMDEKNNFEMTPASVVNLTGALAIDGGAAHSIALKNDGTVWTWGSDAYGQLGRGPTESSIRPAPVTDFSGIVAVAAGVGHNLALKNNGTVWAWGANAQGQLGNWTYANGPGPDMVRGLTGAVAISAGGYHSLALKGDKTVWAWGDNGSGQLGDGNGGGTSKSSGPVPVAGLSGVKAIAAGGNHSLALKSDGTVWAWGDNHAGQLGDGAGGMYVYSVAPVKVASLTGVVAIAAGDLHSLALTSDGTVWAWGSSYYGELGVGSSDNDSTTPVAVNKLTGVVQIVAGDNFSAALKADGVVWAWGSSDYGQLGNGSTMASNVPIASLTGVQTIGLGAGHALAIMGNGATWSWGLNWAGQLGNGRSLEVPKPVVVPSLTAALAVAASRYCSAAVTSDGAVWAWGYDQSEICSGNAAKRNVPVAMGDLTGIIAVSLGDSHRLALKGNGTVWGWGRNSWGQLGNGVTNWSSDVPVQASGLSTVVAIAAGQRHSLALTNDGKVWAWGSNESGQLGGSAGNVSAVPVLVGNLSGVVAIAAGASYSVALKSDGTVWSWGSNSSGQFGDGSSVSSTTPVSASNLNGVVAIAAGDLQTLALKSDGGVWRWGTDFSFQSKVPAVVPGLSGVVAISSSRFATLALTPEGTVWSVSYGGGAVPRINAELPGALSVAAGQEHGLALVGTGIPAIVLQPYTVTFGAQKPGTTSASRSISVINNGEAPLEIRSVNLTGINAADFKKPVDTCAGATLMPHGSCGIDVRFAPKAEGARSAAFMLLTNAPVNPQLVFLSGMALIDTPFPTVVAPNGGENIPTRSAFNIQWTASSPLPLTGFDVSYSADGGTTFSAIPDCTGLPASARNCAWATPGTVTTSGRIRVLARNTAGNTAADLSDADFRIVTEKSTPGVFLNGKWYLDVNGDGYFVYGTDKDYSFGWPGITPVTGDWNGNRRKEIGVFHEGSWFLDLNDNGTWEGPAVDRAFSFGWPGVTPLTGDWTGDGKTEIGIFKDGWWYLDLKATAFGRPP